MHSYQMQFYQFRSSKVWNQPLETSDFKLFSFYLSFLYHIHRTIVRELLTVLNCITPFFLLFLLEADLINGIVPSLVCESKAGIDQRVEFLPKQTSVELLNSCSAEPSDTIGTCAFKGISVFKYVSSWQTAHTLWTVHLPFLMDVFHVLGHSGEI